MIVLVGLTDSADMMENIILDGDLILDMAPAFPHTDPMVTSLLFILTIQGGFFVKNCKQLHSIIILLNSTDVKNCLQIGTVRDVTRFAPEEMARREEMIIL